MTKKDLLDNKVFKMIPDDSILTIKLGEGVLVPLSANDITFYQDLKQRNFMVVSIPEYIDQYYELVM